MTPLTQTASTFLEKDNIITVIECPNDIKREDLLKRENNLFFAGGITGCPNWQADFATLLQDEDLVAFNPRRTIWPIDDPNSTEVQVSWEYDYLNKAEAISFWFPKETDCPITLYELGYWSQSAKAIFVGMEPGYSKKNEIITRPLRNRQCYKLWSPRSRSYRERKLSLHLFSNSIV